MGFVLALIMFYLVVLNNVRGPVNILVCASCLGLLFFEVVFGIYVGCKIYNLCHKQEAQYCPGGPCDLSKARISIQSLNLAQKAIFALSVLALLYLIFGDIVEFFIFN
ncbi:hypothetical protein [Isorropodon fossajaponicum symbiont]|uniref:hypothetical protein n=1 Tax=Isorropodon fossajaponicum symbiont TaxID=883811 RepID=UPI001915CAA8|nr:hypothetical protein [Isorropodon fossajaponicum symbiont]